MSEVLRWLLPPLITAGVTAIGLLVANPLAPPRRAERKLTRILANLDKLPAGAEFDGARAVLQEQARVAAVDTAAGMRVPTPWRRYAVCAALSALAIAVVWIWWDFEDPTLQFGATQILSKVVFFGIFIVGAGSQWMRAVRATREARSRVAAEIADGGGAQLPGGLPPGEGVR